MKKKIPNQLLDPDLYLRPSIKMSPFSGKITPFDFSNPITEKFFLRKISLKIFDEDVPGIVTLNGREAINLALEKCVKSPNDLVSIITSSRSAYVSSCVTSAISKHCKYIVGFSKEANIYFVIHEFGYFCKLPRYVLSSKKIIIEDCAYSMIDRSIKSDFGSYGDFVILSFSKAFPVSFGGALFSRKVKISESRICRDNLSYLINILNPHIKKLRFDNLLRLKKYNLMKKVAIKYGFNEFVISKSNSLPHAFFVKFTDDFNLNSLKIYMNKFGIESSIFYGKKIYFLPCHQNLNDWEIEYIFHHLFIGSYEIK